MSEGGWTPGEPERRPLPRLEDLPTAPEGYDPQAVREAFDAFYRHAAELDATLRTLEAVDAFGRQADALRADIRALRAAAWGPVPTPRAESWHVGYRRRAATGPAGAVSDAFPRVVVETVFILVVAVGAAVAGLSTPLVILLVVAAWLVVGAIEVTASVAGPRLRRRHVVAAPRAEPAPAATVVTPQLEAETGEHAPPEALVEERPAETPVAAEPQPEPQPELQPEPAAVAPDTREEPPAEVETPEPEPVGAYPTPSLPDEADGEELDEDTGVPLEEEEPAVAAAAATPRPADPWEAGPAVPELEHGAPEAESASRLRFWRRRRAPEEASLYPEPSGHVSVIAVRPAGDQPPEPAPLPPSAEGWRPPPVERPPDENLRRRRR